MSETPIYTEMIREAKRRTKRDSQERADLTRMDEATRPESMTGFEPGIAGSQLVRSLQTTGGASVDFEAQR